MGGGHGAPPGAPAEEAQPAAEPEIKVVEAPAAEPAPVEAPAVKIEAPVAEVSVSGATEGGEDKGQEEEIMDAIGDITKVLSGENADELI